MLTLKAPEALIAELESFALERGLTRHAAALEAVAAGMAALRTRGDTSGDTAAGRRVILEVIPDASALADLVAERVVARLAKTNPRHLPAPSHPVTVQAATEGPPAPESRSGRAPGQAPRRPGDYRIGGRRPSDPPEGSVGALLLTWRRSRDMSQGQAAEAFGVQRATWGRWETGKRFPEADVVERVKADVST